MQSFVMKHRTALPQTVMGGPVQYGILSEESYPQACKRTLAPLPQNIVHRKRHKKDTAYENLIYPHCNQ
jgi:hypothetical protein